MGNIKLVPEEKKQSEDLRIQRGQAMERLKNNPDFQLFMTEVTDQRSLTMHEFMVNGNVKGNGPYMKTRIKTLKEIIDLPNTLAFKVKEYFSKESALRLFIEELRNRREVEKKLAFDDDGEYGECVRARLHVLDEVLGIMNEFFIKMKIAMQEEE